MYPGLDSVEVFYQTPPATGLIFLLPDTWDSHVVVSTLPPRSESQRGLRGPETVWEHAQASHA